MYGGEDSAKNDLISGFTTALAGYLQASWQKKKPGTLLPTLVGLPVGILAFAGRKHMRSDTMAAIAEGIGYGQFAWIGEYLAANTTTLGRIPAGSIPMQRATTTTTAPVTTAFIRANANRVVYPTPIVNSGGYELGYSAPASV